MNDKKPQPSPSKTAKTDDKTSGRDKRLQEALRANLKRRKNPAASSQK